MKILISGGRVLDPARNFDQVCDVALDGATIVATGPVASSFGADQVIDATGCVVAPGLVDLSARLREPGYEHEGMLESELAAAVAGGVTALVCPPDTDPMLDESGLVEMLRYRSERLRRARVLPLGALTRQLQGQVLCEMLQLTEAGCVAFSQAEVPVADTLVLLRALQYASTFGCAVWLRPQERYLGQGVAASGPVATRLGLAGVPVAAETIALHSIFELVRATGARVHLCRISSAAGVALVRQAKRDGLPISCDVSINSLLLTDTDIGYFDSQMRLNPPLRQQRDRDALSQALADGTIDALVSDHTPVDADAKALPFAESEAGATGLELLLSLGLKWGRDSGAGLQRALAVMTCGPAAVLGAAPGVPAGAGGLKPGGCADICIFDEQAMWTVTPQALRSQGKHTPFAGYELPARVRWTLVGGHVAYTAA